MPFSSVTARYGCAAIVRNQLDPSYGAADPQRHASPAPDPGNT